MSYEIIKGIKIKDNKVFIKGDSNNVFPKTFEYIESPYFTKILNEKGESEFNLSVMKEFESGNFQSSLKLKWVKALEIIWNNPEFKRHYDLYFNWRTNNFKYDSDEDKEHRARRKSQEFDLFLMKALNTKYPKANLIVKIGENKFIGKVTSRFIRFSYGQAQAKKFVWRTQAEQYAKKVNGEVLEI